MTAFADLMAFQRETEALAQIAGRLGWDQETMMPEGAAEQRGEEMAAIEGVLHSRRTDPRVGDWLASAKATDAAGARALDLIGRSYHRNVAVPGRLAAEIARVTSVAQGIWAEARAKDDVAHFLPVFEKVVALMREKGQALAEAGFGGGDVYDALLDDYEPGATAATIGAMFGRMRPRLVALREKVLGAAGHPAPVKGTFAKEGQLALARELATAFGYDWNRGRLDLAVHPFSSGSGNDARITTRVVEADPFNCLYSTIHEVGHACYELAIDPDHLFTPLGAGVSMGVHESQSRIYENQLGRSRAFTGWLHGRMRDTFGDFGVATAEEFYRSVNRVQSGYIRTEADEVHYNLHIMMRFDLERQVMAGVLEVADLEAAWNARFAEDFGVKVDRPANGVLQDVHWSVGLFGYFPTYTLGNVYAGCLMKALRADLPDIDADLARGDARPATDWLAAKVQRFGGLYRPAEVIERACGFAPSEAPLLDYLDAKFGDLYGL
ncbi:carboxypeptidase M32 [Defluviimonas sp. WL0050]|uniref:Metal-dependent carboxypeptidase n=1 Tax=Albidovulum litorale TaxID=2984134 RepID=A0ABT2ZJ29_9RHOB|nr:carboxypeptidase M32 [Defluviimonas sp. WL0050]MCV2871136.1 carboxypeptidase M32 [Defluviimonas sp. WL0050]